MLQNLQLWLAKASFGSRRLEFYEDLAEALEDDAALVEQLDVWAARAEKEGDVVAPLYRLWLRRMDDRSFAQALIGTVPESDVLILDAAEEAGNLAGGLRFLGHARPQLPAPAQAPAAVRPGHLGADRGHLRARPG